MGGWPHVDFCQAQHIMLFHRGDDPIPGGRHNIVLSVADLTSRKGREVRVATDNAELLRPRGSRGVGGKDFLAGEHRIFEIWNCWEGDDGDV